MYQYKDNQIEINNTKFKFNLILEITPVQNKKALLNYNACRKPHNKRRRIKV